MHRNVNLPEEFLNRVVESIVSAVPTEAVYVFGSYARGEEGESSDLDLYVVTRGGDDRRFELTGKVGRSLLWMGMPKDIVVGSKDRFNLKKDSLSDIESVVSREGIKLYG